MGSNIQEQLDMLYSIVKEAWGVPLSSDKCVLEREKLLDIIDGIRNQLPTELSEAKRLVDARTEFIANAKREAETIRHAAEERAKQLVNEQEIYRIAKAESAEMRSSAEKYSSEVKRAAGEYVDDKLRITEEAITRALEETRKTRTKFRGASVAVEDSAVQESIDEEK